MSDSRGRGQPTMADPRVQRSMSDFPIHSTTMKMDHRDSFDHSALAAPDTPPYHHVFTLQHAKQTPNADELKEQRVFSHGYGSEEELASPVGDDDFSFGSLESETESIATYANASSESLAYVQPSEAHVVQVVSVGKAKVVSMPRLADDVPASPTSPQAKSSDCGSSKPSLDMMSSSGMGQISVFNTEWEWPRASEYAEPASPSPAIGTEHKEPDRPLRRRPLPLHLPSSESARELALVPKVLKIPQTPATSKTVNFVDYEPSTASPVSPLPQSTRSKRRAYKLPSAFNIKTLSWNAKQNNRTSGSADRSATPSFQEMKGRSASMANIHTPPPATPKPLPKMVPRGANERAPPIVLPPCPYDDDEDADGDDEANFTWTRRKDSLARPAGMSPYRPLTQAAAAGDRRKSLPAFVSSEV